MKNLIYTCAGDPQRQKDILSLTNYFHVIGLDSNQEVVDHLNIVYSGNFEAHALSSDLDDAYRGMLLSGKVREADYAIINDTKEFSLLDPELQSKCSTQVPVKYLKDKGAISEMLGPYYEAQKLLTVEDALKEEIFVGKPRMGSGSRGVITVTDNTYTLAEYFVGNDAITVLNKDSFKLYYEEFFKDYLFYDFYEGSIHSITGFYGDDLTYMITKKGLNETFPGLKRCRIYEPTKFLSKYITDILDMLELKGGFNIEVFSDVDVPSWNSKDSLHLIDVNLRLGNDAFITIGTNLNVYDAFRRSIGMDVGDSKSIKDGSYLLSSVDCVLDTI